MRTGFRAGYWIVEWTDEFDPNLAELLARYPELVCGRRVLIASCDSSSYNPTPAEYAKGWTTKCGAAISPVVVDTSELPTPGFDEWYVYAAAVPEERFQSFVNGWGFAPLVESRLCSQEFWAQVEKFCPLHVIGAGAPTMFLVTRDASVYRMVVGV